MPIEIDDKYVDVDFLDDPSYVFGLLPEPFFASSGPDYEDLFGAMSQRDIEEAIEKQDALDLGLDKLVIDIFNQGREGSCVANAWTQGHQVLQAKQMGKDKVVRLSSISLYQRIGRSPNSGANVTTGGEEMSKNGILPLDTPENRKKYGDHVMPATGFYEKVPKGSEATRKLFRGIEMHRCRTVEGIFTANLQGHPVIVGREGHSILYLRPTMYKGRLAEKYANSWDERWGDKGFGYDTQSQIEKSASGAWALRSVVHNK